MPRSIYRKRGRPLRYRTIKLGKHHYAHLAIFKTKGKHGGRTVIGKIHYTKRKRR